MKKLWLQRYKLLQRKLETMGVPPMDHDPLLLQLGQHAPLVFCQLGRLSVISEGAMASNTTASSPTACHGGALRGTGRKCIQ
jgi:hypothetical protein